MHSAKALKWLKPALICSTLAYPAINATDNNTEDLINVLQTRKVMFKQGTLPQLSQPLLNSRWDRMAHAGWWVRLFVVPKVLCEQTKSCWPTNHLVKLRASLQTS
jgi:hypothetical protein